MGKIGIKKKKTSPKNFDELYQKTIKEAGIDPTEEEQTIPIVEEMEKHLNDEAAFDIRQEGEKRKERYNEIMTRNEKIAVGRERLDELLGRRKK